MALHNNPNININNQNTTKNYNFVIWPLTVSHNFLCHQLVFSVPVCIINHHILEQNHALSRHELFIFIPRRHSFIRKAVFHPNVTFFALAWPFIQESHTSINKLNYSSGEDIANINMYIDNDLLNILNMKSLKKR